MWVLISRLSVNIGMGPVTTLREPPLTPAAFTTSSTPSAARRHVSKSRRSPVTTSTRSPNHGLRSCSTTRTRAPSRRSSSTTCAPINPVAPVTRTLRPRKSAMPLGLAAFPEPADRLGQARLQRRLRPEPEQIGRLLHVHDLPRVPLGLRGIEDDLRLREAGQPQDALDEVADARRLLGRDVEGVGDGVALEREQHRARDVARVDEAADRAPAAPD